MLTLCEALCLGESPAAFDTRSVEEMMARVLGSALLQQQRLGQYSVVRQYTVRNRHLKHDAVLRVLWTYEPGKGRRFKVISNQGASGVTRRSIMTLLETEAANSQTKSDPSQIGPDHYTFKFAEPAKDDYRIQLTPRATSKFLVNGFASVASPDWAIVRVEGKTSQRLSYWVSEAYIVQEFARFGEFWLPHKTHSTAKIRFVGETELTIESAEYRFLGAP